MLSTYTILNSERSLSATARNIRQTRFVLDGDFVLLGVDDVSDFNALHSRKRLYDSKSA